MIIEARKNYRIVLGLVIFLLICGVPLVSAEYSNETIALNTIKGELRNPINITENSTLSVLYPASIESNTSLSSLVSPTVTIPILSKKSQLIENVSYDKIEESIDRQITQIEEYKKNRNSAEKKIPDDLLQLIDDKYPLKTQTREQIKTRMKNAKQLIPQREVTAKLTIRNKSLNSLGDQVKIEIQVKPSVSTRIVDPYITQITGRDEESHLVVAWVDINNLDRLASLDGVSVISSIEPMGHSIGSVTTQGDSILNADDVRNIGFNGNEIKVGVISDGVDHISDAQVSTKQDLPTNVHILNNGYGGDEGTAMLEIVHDIAPDAELYFHGSDNDATSFNHALDDLIAANCNIICDDSIFYNEPYFEDGVISSHLKDVMRTHPNLIFVTAAGNFAKQHYQGTFKDDGRHYNDFRQDLGSSDKYLYDTMHYPNTVLIEVQWDDKWGSSANDYDLYLIEKGTDNIVAASTRDQPNYPNPVESITYQYLGTDPKTFEIRIKNAGPGGVGQGQIKNLELFVFRTSDKVNTIQPDTNFNSPDSIYGPAAVREAITVGAVPSGFNGIGNVDQITSYSSRGPSTISYPVPEIRQKPDICGITNVFISGAGEFGSPPGQWDGIHWIFPGTSAAAPHIAGIVALAKQANPSLTRSQIKHYLTSSAIDLGTPGWDPAYGYGRANAQAMIQQIQADGEEATHYVTITSIAGPHGSITPSSVSGEFWIHKGTSQIFTITQSPGYVINDVQINGQSVGPISTYTFSNIQSDAIITATFNQIPPTANFAASPISGNPTLGVYFTDISTGSPTSWSWNFGDGQTSTMQNPFHAYSTAGTYTITMTVSNDAGSNTKVSSGYITVISSTPTPTPTPISSFTATPTNGTAPLTIQFTDTSTNSPTAWSWTFGDGNTSAEQNPAHTYALAGNYTLSLTAANAGGSNMTTRTNYITVQPPTEVRIGSENISQPGGNITLALNLTFAPKGLSGYNVNLSVSNSTVAQIMEVSFPAWASSMNSAGPLPATRDILIKASDVNSLVEIGASEIPLANVTVRGLSHGVTEITLSRTNFDDDDGTDIPHMLVNGTLTVGSP